MEVKYNPPITSAKGLYVFQEPLERISTESVRVSSLDDYLARQARVLDVTQRIVDYLRTRQLPEGVEGNVEVMFRLWDANRHILGLGNVGQLGFPDISIQTNYGQSSLYLWPKGNGGEVEVHGRGLAEEIVTAFQGDFEKVFGAPDSQLNRWGGHMSPLSLTARLLIPKPRG